MHLRDLRLTCNAAPAIAVRYLHSQPSLDVDFSRFWFFETDAIRLCHTMTRSTAPEEESGGRMAAASRSEMKPHLWLASDIQATTGVS